MLLQDAVKGSQLFYPYYFVAPFSLSAQGEAGLLSICETLTVGSAWGFELGRYWEAVPCKGRVPPAAAADCRHCAKGRAWDSAPCPDNVAMPALLVLPVMGGAPRSFLHLRLEKWYLKVRETLSSY